MGRIWQWLHATDAITWAGHGVQGFLIVLVAGGTGLGVGAGIFAVAVHFLLRELPGMVVAVRAGNTLKLRDGLFDLMAPFAGVALYAVLF